jgi:hypothetical protein
MGGETGRGLVGTFSSVGAWLIPAWGCPVCLSAFAGTMSALGLGFVATRAVLTPLTAVFIGVALLALGFGARRRRRYGALILGAAGAGLLLVSKFLPAEAWLGYSGLVGLVGASLWNTRIAAARPVCPSPAEPEVSTSH